MIWSRYLEKVSIKQPVLYFFSNSRSLEQPGLIIESLEYCPNIYTVPVKLLHIKLKNHFLVLEELWDKIALEFPKQFGH